MATPGAVRALRAVSVCATGGAALYLLSDGGDPKVLEARTESARAAAQARAETLPAEVSDLYAAAVARLPDVSSIELPSLPSIDLSSMTGRANQLPVAVPEVAEPAHNDSPGLQRPSSVFCHTCSGPRIWYLTEKLRFKRRISPHPDPTDE